MTELAALPEHPHPALDPSTHALRVDGLVARPLTLDRDSLAALEQHELIDEFACLEGWTVPGLRWRGPRLADVLALAGASDDAPYVQASAADFSVPLLRADVADALLAIELNGEPLPLAHGAPVRLVIPGGECYTSIKWLERLELRREPAPNTARTVALARLRGPA